MDRARGEVDRPLGEQLGRARLLSDEDLGLVGQERTDLRDWVLLDLRNGPLGDDVPTVRARPRPQLDEPVRLPQYLCVMVDEHDGVAVGDKVACDAVESLDVGGVQSDGGLVEHVEDAGRAIPHRTRQLHSLTLAGRERRGGAVE